MEFIKISPSESKLWEQVWRLYTDSFPEWERRRISSHDRASEDDDFHTYIALDNGNFIGLVFYWKYASYIFIEHLAVAPQLRGKNIGSKIITALIEEHPQHTILLEIDPPADDISKRRLRFYERLGFVINDFEHIHPSFSRNNGKEHELRIMSYPDRLTQEEFDRFRDYMYDRIMKYID